MQDMRAGNLCLMETIEDQHQLLLSAARVRVLMVDGVMLQTQAVMFYDIPDYPFADVAWVLFAHFTFVNDILLDQVVMMRLKRSVDSGSGPEDQWSEVFVSCLHEAIGVLCDLITQHISLEEVGHLCTHTFQRLSKCTRKAMMSVMVCCVVLQRESCHSGL